VRKEATGDQSATEEQRPTLLQSQVIKARNELLALHMAEPVECYVVALVLASRNPPAEVAPLLELGASPRGTIGLDLCARAAAWLDGRDFVSPDDVQSVAHDVLRHRLICSFGAEAQGVTSDQVIDQLLHHVPVP